MFDPSTVSNNNKLKLTLDSSQISTDQIDFPLTVNLDSTDPLHEAIFTELGVNSKKLSIEADGVQCPVEIEHWDSSAGRGTLHTKVPTYSASTDTGLVLSWDSTQIDNADYVGYEGDTVTGDTLENIMPVMTTTPQDGVSVVASSSHSSYPVWKAFDRGLTAPPSWASRSGVSSATITVDLGEGESAAVVEYTIIESDFSDRAPRDWTLEGSNDNTNWDVLHTVTLETNWEAGVAREFVCTSPGSYRYYRIVMTENNGNSYFQITELELLAYAVTRPAQSVWDSSFVAVYHMSQDPSVGGACILDSTSNEYHGTPSGSMTSLDLVDGLVGKALDFDGVDNFISCGNIGNGVGFTNLSAEVLLNPRGVNTVYLLSKDGSGANVGDGSLWYNQTDELAWRNIDAAGDVVGGTGVTGDWIFSTYTANSGSHAIYENGVLVGTLAASYTTVWNNSEDVEIGGVLAGSSLFDGIVGEVRISDITRSDDWIKLTNLSLTDQLITWKEYSAVGLLRAVLEQNYDLSYEIVAAVLEQSYSVSGDIKVSSEQIYSMLLELWGMQYYGDVPCLQKRLTQYYGSAVILQKSLSQMWGEALELTTDLKQNWSMPDLLNLVSDQQYGIASEILHKTSEQLYHINQLSTLFASSHQAYAIAGEVATLYRFDTKLFVAGEQIPFIKLQWESSENDYFWSCEAVVASKEVAVKCADGAELRIDWAGASCFLKCYDGWMLDKRPGSESYRIKGFSKAKDLYYAPKLSGDIAGGMASQLVADLASSCGITLDWQMDDGYIQSGKLVANDESPLDVIRKIVWDCKGKLRPTLDGNLIAAYEEEVAVPDYPTTTPADTIIARMERISTSESRDEQQGYNKFTVSDQLASDESRSLVKDMIDSRTAELREYATPLYEGLDFDLSHKGPASVSIEPFGLVEKEIEDELIIFENGSARTSLPIYAITKRTWQTQGLGLVSFSEDGLLTAEIKEYGLLRLSYITKYFRWLAKHPSVADVLFTADEVSQ